MTVPSPSEAAAKVANAAVATQSSAKDFKKESTAARFLGAGMYKSINCRLLVLISAGTAGIAELMIFHPVDTTAKRLMSHHGKVRLSAQRIPDKR